MTGNQVSYASVQVSQQVADETERHNRQTEEEASRHNQEVERLTGEQNRIDQQRVNINYDIESTKNRLQGEYNDIMKNYYSASLEEKAWYDTQIAYIKQEELFTEKRYKEQMAAVAQDQNVLEASKNAEIKRHNEVVENLNQRANEISQFGKDIEARRIEYQARQWETENWLNFERYGLQYQELGLKQLQEQHTYELGLMNMEAVGAQNLLKSDELQLKREMFSMEQQLLPYREANIKSQTISNYWANVNNTLHPRGGASFSDVLKGVSLFAPLLGL